MISSSNDYATALFMLALENDSLDRFADNLDTVKKVFEENPDYALLLGSPALKASERAEIINAAFEGNIDRNIINFISLLCDHNKISALFDCVNDFVLLKKAAENCVTAYVSTAVPLTDIQQEKLKANLQKRLGGNVIIKTVIDKSIIGGVKIEVDGKIIDGSVKEQLHSIKEVISG